jgi:hypothetical protein
VVQLVEDTLAQTGAAHADLLSNNLTRFWQTEVLETCLATTANRFPFADGADADPEAMARLLGPGGMVDRFVKGRAGQMLDMTYTPWRWKPEDRFDGLTPDSAIFLQRATEIGAGLFPGGQPGATMTLSALAERGRSFRWACRYRSRRNRQRCWLLPRRYRVTFNTRARLADPPGIGAFACWPPGLRDRDGASVSSISAPVAALRSSTAQNPGHAACRASRLPRCCKGGRNGISTRRPADSRYIRFAFP